MKNLTGYLKLILLILYSSTFLCFSLSNIYAQEELVKTTGELNYSINNADLNCSYKITLASDSNYPTYIHYFTVNIPFTSIENVDVEYENQSIRNTVYSNEKNTQVIPDFSGIIVKAGVNQTFTINFTLKNFPGLNDPKIKRVVLPVNFANDLSIRTMTLSYSQNIGDLNYISVPYDDTRTNGIISEIIFNNPTEKTITALIGNDVVYNFNINEIYDNSGSENERVVEINIPKTNYNQIVIIKNISPQPEYSKIDDNKNIIAYYRISPNESLNVQINAQIIMGRNSAEQYLSDDEKAVLYSHNDYWSLPDSDLLNEYELYKSSNNYDSDIEAIYSFVLSIFSNEFSIERARMGSLYNFGNRAGLSDEDYVDSTIAILRSYHIPSRMVEGFIYNNQKDESIFLHSWVEYWDDNTGWTMLDPALDEITSTEDYGVDYYDHIAIISRENNPITPNILYSGTSTVNVTMVSTHDDPIANLSVDIDSDVTTNIEGSSILDITVTNSGNIPLMNVNLENGENTISLIDADNVLLPGQSSTKSLSLSKNSVDDEMKVIYYDSLGVSQEIFSNFNVTNVNLWWWDYLVSLLSFSAFSIILSLVYFIYNRVRYEKK